MGQNIVHKRETLQLQLLKLKLLYVIWAIKQETLTCPLESAVFLVVLVGRMVDVLQFTEGHITFIFRVEE
jgi:hypothetical protein